MTLEELINYEEKESKATWNGKPTLCAEEHKQLAEWLKDYKRLLAQESCTDAISRQVAIKAICRHCTPKKPERCPSAEICDNYQELKALPSVTPSEKVGKWRATCLSNIAYCSECDNLFRNIPTDIVEEQFKYCPNCGSRMIQESEE